MSHFLTLGMTTEKYQLKISFNKLNFGNYIFINNLISNIIIVFSDKTIGVLIILMLLFY